MKLNNKFDTSFLKIKNAFAQRDYILREEQDGAIFYGQVGSKYKTFKLKISETATFLFELIQDGITYEEIYEVLSVNGFSKELIESELNALIAISNFDRTHEALSNDIIVEELTAPINITWDITNACNLQCDHCINASGKADIFEMSTEECLSVIDQLSEMGVYNIWIGGGEPLAKKDIDKILHHGKKKGLHIILATNGKLLLESKYLKLVGETCAEVNLSLDGMTEEDHSYLRGKSAKLSEVVSAIKLLKSNYSNIWVTALTVVHTENLFKLESLIDFCYEIGCDKWTHDELYLLGRASLKYKDIVLKYTDYISLYQIVNKKADEYQDKMLVERYVRMVTPSQSNNMIYGCSAGRSEISIQQNGDVFPCQKMQLDKYLAGNLKTTSLKEIWESSKVLNEIRNLDINESECAGCESFLNHSCNGGCMAEKEIVFGTNKVRDPMCPKREFDNNQFLRQ